MEYDSPLTCLPSTHCLWKNEIDTLLQAIEGGLSGKSAHIAIISEFLAGKQDLATQIECAYPGRFTRITLDSFVDDLSIFRDLPESEIYIIENCHFLAQRKIDGFLVLHTFIEMILQSKRIWVTTWNIHSWRYLAAVQKIHVIFPVQIILGPKNYEKLKEYILSDYESSVFYVIDRPVSRRLILIKKHKKIQIPFFLDEVVIPTFRIRYKLIWGLLRGKSHEVEPDELIFQRLAQVSNGNPGIAKRIWERSLDAWEIRMSAFTSPVNNGSFDPDTAYVLSLILSLEMVTIDDLRSVTPPDINLNYILAQLHDKNLIRIKEGLVYITSLALTGITAELKKIRMVW